MIESLLKLKCQQALAQGDYDSLSSYSQQLIMFQQGMPIGEMPIGEELKELDNLYIRYMDLEVSPVEFWAKAEEVFGTDLTNVWRHFVSVPVIPE